MQLKYLENNADVVYIVFQEEEGEEGTPHIQGYIQLASRKRISGVKAIVGDRAHLERARGSPTQNRTYCTKEDTRLGGPFEFGAMRGQGKRNDLHAIVATSMEEELTDKLMFAEYPDIYAKYPRFVTRLRSAAHERNVIATPLIARDGWQTELVRFLTTPPDSRKVRWYVDTHGNTGKSYFATHYQDKRTYIITGGRYADIFMGFNYEPIVFFDLARCRQESCPYEVMETFKNGYFLSTKYEVRRVNFNVPHVVVFANFEPDRTQLSADRWDIHYIHSLTSLP